VALCCDCWLDKLPSRDGCARRMISCRIHGIQCRRSGEERTFQDSDVSRRRHASASFRIAVCIVWAAWSQVMFSATTPENRIALQHCRAMLDPPLRTHNWRLAQCPPTSALFQLENTAMGVGCASRRGKSLKQPVHLNRYFRTTTCPSAARNTSSSTYSHMDTFTCMTEHRMPIPRIRFYDAPPARSD
jgi:hypothetical protein